MDENKRFREIIKLYRLEFNLTQDSVELLAQLKPLQYSRIESGKQNPDLQDVARISQVYGLKCYELLNPAQPNPSYKNLPKETQKMIKKLKEEGVSPKHELKKAELGKHLDKLIETGLLNRPVSAKVIFDNLPQEIQNTIKEPRKITDLFNRSPRNGYVQKYGKSGSETLFILKESSFDPLNDPTA